MAPGIILFIVGAIFTFALKADSSWLNMRVVGLILMLGGAAFIARARLKRRDAVAEESELHDSQGSRTPS
ncbi:hypothetical protein D0Z08_10325 [Nocardioides immobilis]|uniref:LPXTG cell wall anchor domain-containing protein n=1 Tax=Nocardioides immobilis TaxID=2049295 RepID=A0A417Y3A7_9ACTN|nr:hypothetical protein [Nocardioides immobilis]RHW27061.1 hypothetical protein D0Z08_10325 [Nocardioides immobilis]